MFDKKVEFIFPWRDYQQEVIDKAQGFISDRHIHVVAAPGSGKTVLGLELMRRIDKPTVILAPTIAIRNQWADRFMQLFLQKENLPNWISLDANKPAKVTIITYQALFSVLSGRVESDEAPEPEEESLANVNKDSAQAPDVGKLLLPEDADTPLNLKSKIVQPDNIPDSNPHNLDKRGLEFLEKLDKLKVKVLVVDEAHHLRNEWWKSLQVLKEAINNPVVVALTATPPYDVEQTEWRRYHEFCGPIDIEVPIPTLVARNNLCPHQDYIHYSTLTNDEENNVKATKKLLKRYVDNLQNDQALINALTSHPVVISSKQNQRLLFDNAEYFSAVGSFLKKSGHFKPAKRMMRYITGRRLNLVPKFKASQVEIILENIFFKDPYFRKDTNEPLRERLAKQAKQIGLLDMRQVNLTDNATISRIIRDSTSKLRGIERVVQLEYNNLKDSLNCVILTDYIRKDFLPSQENQEPELKKLGVVPIFEQLRRGFAAHSTHDIAVLTGTMVVIPQSQKKVFISELKKAANTKKRQPKVSFLSYPTDDRYLLCSVNDSSRQYVVATVTNMFEQGRLRVIVGTKALLGEGWDAPSLNTLLLASFVGSFMLSNQMRGRAIRVSKDNPNKTANIWHFAALAPNATTFIDEFKSTEDLGPELRTLQRRFEMFVGISIHDEQIESGLPRATYLTRPPYPIGKIVELAESANSQSSSASRDRASMAQRWRQILENGAVGRLVHTTEPEVRLLPRGPIFINTIKAAVISALYTWLIASQDLLGSIGRSPEGDGREVMIIFAIVGIGGGVLLLLRVAWLLILSIRHRTSKGSTKQIGIVLLDTLCEIGAIKTRCDSMEVVVTENHIGQVSCGIVGGATYESEVFLDAVDELLSPIENPRYLLADQKKNRLLWFRNFLGGVNYYPVPSVIASHRKFVEVFAQNWRKRVGACHGIYTRNIEGRKLMLNARRKSLATKLNSAPKRHTVWN